MRPFCSIRQPIAAGLSALALALAGCAQTTMMKVDALHQPAGDTAHSFAVVPGNVAVSTDDPQFQAAAREIAAALTDLGLEQTDRPWDADMIVELDYGVGASRVQLRQTAPPAPPGTAQGREFRVKRIDLRTGMIIAEETGDPGAGMPNRVHASVVYEKHLSASARVGQEETWRVEVAVEDDNADLASCLPALARVAAAHIGTSTEERRTVLLKTDRKQD